MAFTSGEIMKKIVFYFAFCLLIQNFVFADSPKKQDFKSKPNPIEQSEKTRINLLKNGVIASWHIECCQLAENFFKKADQEDYLSCWEECDPLLQQAISQNEWQRDLHASRFYLGNVTTRSLNKQIITWDPQGMPEGPYIVINYNAKSSKGFELAEVVTLKKGIDNKWRVLMYQISQREMSE
jgi:hypothetical protein